MNRRVTNLLFVAATAIAIAGCTTREKQYECIPAPDAATVEPATLWNCNRDVIDRAIRGKRFTIRELDEASRFFETLTGIPAHLDDTRFGPIPDERLADDLAAWDAWYDEHAGRLYWDGASVRPGS